MSGGRKAFVYFAQAEPGAPIKIGQSDAPSTRVRSLRCPATGKRPHLLAVTHSHGSEWRMHQRFIDQAIARSPQKPNQPTAYTEWFRPAPDLLAFIESIKSR